MRRRITTLFGLTLAMVVSLAPASFAGTARQSVAPYSGDQVAPGPGDPDGTGGVFVATGKKTGSFCFFSDTANISPQLTALHLHRGDRGEVGEEIVELHGPANDPDTSGCVHLDRRLVRDIGKHGEDYYIDVHNDEFPEGAIRAQLG